MKRWYWVGLVVLGLAVTLAASWKVTVPGYMDAEYYYGGGARLAQGRGLTELLLWNYLDQPTSLPHPSHAYWMPGASLLSALSMKLGGVSFPAARLPFLLVGASIPMLTAWLALKLTGRPRDALLAGAFAAFSGFYLPYFVTTETFGLYMLFGTLLTVLAFADLRPFELKTLLMGLLAGGMHLARADGLLWLAAALAVTLLQGFARRKDTRFWLSRSLASLILILAGYAAVTGFWYARNLNTFHTLMPPGGSRTLFLTNYDQTFTYPATNLTFQSWLASGWKVILSARGNALLENLKTWVGVQGEIFLFPLLLVGLWRLRKDPRVRFGAAMWLVTLLVMSLAFPFAGPRGGFLHSSSALQPLFWAVMPVGFGAFVDLGIRWRNWKDRRAWIGFGLIFTGMAAAFTLITYARLVFGSEPGKLAWNESWDSARAAETYLTTHYGAADGQYVMVNNPPGYFAATGRPSLVIPDVDEDAVQRIAKTYQVEYLVLEKNHVHGLDALYQDPGNRAWLTYLGEQDNIQFYKIKYNTSP